MTVKNGRGSKRVSSRFSDKSYFFLYEGTEQGLNEMKVAILTGLFMEVII